LARASSDSLYSSVSSLTPFQSDFLCTARFSSSARGSSKPKLLSTSEHFQGCIQGRKPILFHEQLLQVHAIFQALYLENLVVAYRQDLKIHQPLEVRELSQVPGIQFQVLHQPPPHLFVFIIRLRTQETTALDPRHGMFLPSAKSKSAICLLADSKFQRDQ
jgi:hypothetical protein